jgi:hypothetical protein
MTIHAMKLAIRLTVLAGAASACSTPSDPYWLLGTWEFETQTNVTVSCGGAPPLDFEIGGSVVSLTETASGVELDLGCRCRLRMSGGGELDGGGQSCALLGAAPTARALAVRPLETGRIRAG